MTVTFTVPGEPQGKARPRVTRMGHAYTPERTRSYEAEVIRRFRIAEQGTGFVRWEKSVPLTLTVRAYYGIPKSANKRMQAAMLEGRISPTKKPDTDNIGKIVADALNGIAWYDDAQITELRVIKQYSADPRVEISITGE